MKKSLCILLLIAQNAILQGLSFSGHSSTDIHYTIGNPKASVGDADFRGLSNFSEGLELQASHALNTNWTFKGSAYAKWNALYQIKGQEKYEQGLLDSQELKADLKDFYIEGDLTDSLHLKVGKQVINWGRSDHILISSLLNPLDTREPGLQDLRNLYIPLTMTQLQWEKGSWGLSGVMIHEVRFHKQPAYGSEFYPSATNLSSMTEIKPDDPEYAVAIDKQFESADISIFWQQLYNDDPYLELVQFPLYRWNHSRQDVWGFSGNYILGNWIVKSENAYITGIGIQNITKRKKRLDSLIGIEYSGLTNTYISTEAAIRHLFDYDTELSNSATSPAENSYQYALTIRKSLLNNKLNLHYTYSLFTSRKKDGDISRVQAEYELRKNTLITTGIVTYSTGNQESFKQISENDRVFVNIKQFF